jgi:LysM domain-containing protein
MADMARTYVRRRLAISALVVCLAAIVTGPVANALSATGPGDRAGERTHVVRPGETLWSIAVRFSDGADPRALVDRLTVENRVEAGSLVPGQVLVIPVHD